jgi:DNA-binding transcriptional ArsR family regulator
MKNKKAKLSGENLALTGATGKEKVVVNFGTIKRAALTLRAIHHPLRKKLLEVINSKENITVTEIYVKLKLEQSVASQHLALLRRANLVITKREGKYIHYFINQKRMAEIADITAQLASE